MDSVEFCGVSKRYKEKTAVDNLDLKLQKGIYGLLGENGAGKTTMMRMMCGILRPTEGQVLCDGIPIEKMGGDYRALLGYLPQDFGYYEDFTAQRFLRYMAALKALPEKESAGKIEELLELTGLAEEKKHKLKTFSGGMLRRVGIAQALLNNPAILVLDEPTSGLDPKERVRFRNIISSLGRDRIIVLSTHIVSDVESIADEIMIMKRGRLVTGGTEEEIMTPVSEMVWEWETDVETAERMQSRYVVVNLKNRADKVVMRILSKEKPVAEAVSVEAALEDAYLYYTTDVDSSGASGR